MLLHSPSAQIAGTVVWCCKEKEVAEPSAEHCQECQRRGLTKVCEQVSCENNECEKRMMDPEQARAAWLMGKEGSLQISGSMGKDYGHQGKDTPPQRKLQ